MTTHDDSAQKGEASKPSKRHKLNRTLYARLRAAGVTRREAVQQAGSRATTPRSLDQQAYELEKDPSVVNLIETYGSSSAANLEEAWEASARWARGVFEDPESTNLDKRGAAEFVAKATGRFTQQVEVQVHHHLPFRSLVRPDEVLLPPGVTVEQLPDEAGEGNDHSRPLGAADELPDDQADELPGGES